MNIRFLKRFSASSLYLILILGIALVFRLWALNQSFWLDEAAQAVISENPFKAGNFDGDFQPPLSYVLSHIWIQLSNALGTQAEWFLRLPSVFFGVGSVYMLYLLLRKLSDTKTASIGALLLAVAPFHIYYSQEFRMYSLLTFLSITSWYFLLRKNWWGIAVVAIITAYTHYFAFLIIASQGLYLVLFNRGDIKKWLLPHLASMSLFIFWLPTFLKQIQTSQALLSIWPQWGALSNVGFVKFPILLAAKFTVGMISPEPKMLYGLAVLLFCASFACLFVSYSVQAFRIKKVPQSILFLFSMCFFPIAIAWLGGIWIQAASPWRVQFALPALYGCIAYMAVSIQKNSHSFFLRAGVTIILAYLVGQNILFSSMYLGDTQNHRENWREAVTYTDSKATQDSIVVTEYSYIFAPIAWYTQRPDAYMGASTQPALTALSVEKKLEPFIESKKQIVVYSYLFEISDPNKELESYLTKNAYTLNDEQDFRGVGIIRTYIPKPF